MAIYRLGGWPQYTAMKLETLAVHAGYHVDSATGAVIAVQMYFSYNGLW